MPTPRRDSFNSDGAVWLGRSNSNASSRRNSRHLILEIPSATHDFQFGYSPLPTFGEETSPTSSFFDYLADEVGSSWYRILANIATISLVALVVLSLLQPKCLEPCPPAVTGLDSTFAVASPHIGAGIPPYPPVSTPGFNLGRRENHDNANQVPDRRAGVPANAVWSFSALGQSFVKPIAQVLAIEAVWNVGTMMFGSDEPGINLDKVDPFRAQGWDRVINRLDKTTSWTNRMEGSLGVIVPLYQGLESQYSKESSSDQHKKIEHLQVLGKLGEQQMAINQALGDYLKLISQASHVLADYRHPGSGKKQMKRDAYDLKILHAQLTKLNARIDRLMASAQNQIVDVETIFEEISWKAQSSRFWCGGPYKKIADGMGQLDGLKGTLTNLRATLSSDLYALR